MDIRHFFFKYRSYTPIPLIILVLIIARTTWISYLAGLTVLLAGEAMRFWGVAYAGSATRTTGRAGADKLITDGPFSHVRNPLYLGNFLLSLGVVIMCWAWMPWMILIFLLLFYLQYSLIVVHEEEFLSQHFGDEFGKYVSSVPRWLPKLFAYKNRTRIVPKYDKAVQSERRTFQSIITVCLLILVRWLVL